MRLSDRVTGLFMVALGALAAYGGSRLPPVPGQQIGPDVFPLVVGIGLAICGGMIAFGVGRHYEEEAEADLAKITANITGHMSTETGEADAYGHKKLGGIGSLMGEALKELTGQHIIYQQLSYLMRSGAPDSLDLMVSVNYANMAMSLILRKEYGRMMALHNGIYTNVPMSTITEGLKRVDVDELYDKDQYRPKVRNVDGKPMFLY
jgi:6-phosphofructokinase